MPENKTLRNALLVDGIRIPFQRAGGSYKSLMAHELARMVIQALVNATRVSPDAVDWVIMGNVVSNIATSNVARDAALAAGLPRQVPAATVSLACISANKAITNAVELVRSGQADVVIAGGTESLSDMPIGLRKPFRVRLLEAQKYRSKLSYLKFFRGLKFRDLLPQIPAIAEFSTGRTMGEDCDMMASRFGVSREAQDAYALQSHQKAAAARNNGALAKEIAPVTIPPGFQVTREDDGIREDASREKLAALKPAFVKPYGTLTAGNSSFLTDGAAAVLIVAESVAERLSLRAKARIHSYAYSAQEPADELLLGPAYAIPKLLEKSRTTLADIDVFEFHEAFAAQVLANLKCLASLNFARKNLGQDAAVGEIPMEKLNRWGGSLALGHPFGATGARLVTTAANRLIQEDGQLAIVASCAAGAMGNALLLERV